MRAPNHAAPAARPWFFVQFAYGTHRRELALPPALAYALFGLIPVLVFACLGVGAYAMFRDDMLASLMRRQARMQFAYEDRIAALRSQIDTIASRQMLNQDSFEGKVAELAVRQARLESRSALVSALAAKVDPADGSSIAARRAPASPLAASPSPAAAFAPPVAAKPALARENAKPAPEGFDLRRTQPLDAPGEDVSENIDPTAPGERLRNLAKSFDRMEQKQIAALDGLRAPAAAKAERLREAFNEAGLPVERMMRHAASLRPLKSANSGSAGNGEAGNVTAMGGPFEPAPLAPGAGAFERAYAGVNTSVSLLDGLRRALPYAPLRQPLPGPLDVTSSFGYRTDPFLGRPALHSGMDLRGDYGDPIRATAAGRVVVAGASGGYGNMVEVDHGAGLATRYGHMSHIDVEEGQWVEAGAILGEIGSTGRSTGPHLHYEVRVDGAAVDPSRYLRAGKNLNAAL
jgi:murein DD-endopeptidase MepM/ murein hydrolase activator NlpD